MKLETFHDFVMKNGGMATDALFDAWYAEMCARPDVGRRVEWAGGDEPVVSVRFYLK